MIRILNNGRPFADSNIHVGKVWLQMNFRMVASLLRGIANNRQNKRMFWASLIGLGVSATAMGLRRTRYRNVLPQIQQAAERFIPSSMMKNTALAEFSSELFTKPPSGSKTKQ
ncbi:hypothetical protein [Neobacillus notoginsengisoli]|nr:hypothetical protein [Neobacillus notoginsengisoli]